MFTGWREAKAETWRWREARARRQDPRPLDWRTDGKAGGDQDLASSNTDPPECPEGEILIAFL